MELNAWYRYSLKKTREIRLKTLRPWLYVSEMTKAYRSGLAPFREPMVTDVVAVLWLLEAVRKSVFHAYAPFADLIRNMSDIP